MRKIGSIIVFIFFTIFVVQRNVVATEKNAPLEQKVFVEGRFDEVIAVLERQLAVNRDDPDLKFYLASSFIQSGTRYAEAVDLLQESLAADPGNLRYALLLGRAQVAMAEANPHAGSFLEAGSVFETFGSILKRDAKNYEALVWLAQAHEIFPASVGADRSQARALLERAISVAPDRILARYSLARHHLRLGKDPLHEQALELLQDAEDAYADATDDGRPLQYVDRIAFGWVLLEKAKIHYQRMEPAAFAAAIRRHLQLVPDSGEGWLYLGLAREMERNRAGALQAFQTGLHLAEAAAALDLVELIRRHISRVNPA